MLLKNKAIYLTQPLYIFIVEIKRCISVIKSYNIYFKYL